jgi:hypothetical protein
MGHYPINDKRGWFSVSAISKRDIRIVHQIMGLRPFRYPIRQGYRTFYHQQFVVFLVRIAQTGRIGAFFIARSTKGGYYPIFRALRARWTEKRAKRQRFQFMRLSSGLLTDLRTY